MKNATKKQIDEAVLDICNHFKKTNKKIFTNYEIRAYSDYFNLNLSGSDIRSSLHRLRTSGHLPLLLASNKGYYFASNTTEVKKYLKSLHKRALLIHKLFGAVKGQAEVIMGSQFEFDFYSDIYNTKKNNK